MSAQRLLYAQTFGQNVSAMINTIVFRRAGGKIRVDNKALWIQHCYNEDFLGWEELVGGGG